MYVCIYTHISIYIYIYIYAKGIRLDNTKTAPYYSLIKSQAKKLTKIHEIRKFMLQILCRNGLS